MNVKSKVGDILFQRHVVLLFCDTSLKLFFRHLLLVGQVQPPYYGCRHGTAVHTTPVGSPMKELQALFKTGHEQGMRKYSAQNNGCRLSGFERHANAPKYRSQHTLSSLQDAGQLLTYILLPGISRNTSSMLSTRIICLRYFKPG